MGGRAFYVWDCFFVFFNLALPYFPVHLYISSLAFSVTSLSSFSNFVLRSPTIHELYIYTIFLLLPLVDDLYIYFSALLLSSMFYSLQYQYVFFHFHLPEKCGKSEITFGCLIFKTEVILGVFILLAFVCGMF